MATDPIQLYEQLSNGAQQELKDAVAAGMTTMLPSRYFIRETMPYLSEWGVALALSGSRWSGKSPLSPQRVRIPPELFEYIRASLEKRR
jgi:hypothetical protein